MRQQNSLKRICNLASIGNYAMHLKQLDPFIGDLPLRSVHLGTLQAFIEARRQQGIKTKSINLALSGGAADSESRRPRLWRDENGLTWLETSAVDPDCSRSPMPASRTHCRGRNNASCSRHSRITWPVCACSRLIRVAGNRKCAN